MRCQCGFNASKCARAEGYGNTLVLVPSRNSARGRCCFAVSPPSMPTGRSLFPENTQNKPCKCAKAQSAGTEGTTGRARYGTHGTHRTHETSCALTRHTCFARSAVDLSRTEQAALPLRLCGKITLAVQGRCLSHPRMA